MKTMIWKSPQFVSTIKKIDKYQEILIKDESSIYYFVSQN